MKEFWSKIGEVVRHYQATTVTIIMCVVLCGWAFGCAAQTASIINPTVKVTRAEATIELETLLAKAELQAIEFDKQDEIKNAIFNAGIILLEGGTLNPVGIVTTFAGILGIGAIVDNRRKDGIIIGKLKSG